MCIVKCMSLRKGFIADSNYLMLDEVFRHIGVFKLT